MTSSCKDIFQYISSGLLLGLVLKLKNGSVIKKPFLNGIVIASTCYGLNKAYQWPVNLINRAETILEKEPNILDLPSGIPPITQ